MQGSTCLRPTRRTGVQLPNFMLPCIPTRASWCSRTALRKTKDTSYGGLGARHTCFAVAAPPAKPSPVRQQGPTADVFEAVCPICQQTKFTLRPGADRLPQQLHCERCARTFSTTEPFVDLTTTAGVNQQIYQQQFWPGTEIFRSPLVSRAYERGWRQGFSWAGFPGADKELLMALDYFEPAWGEVLLDMSCGSGLFSRRFVASGKFKGVIAADFSASMLRQAAQFFSEDRSLSPQKYVLLKADAGRLPFATESLSAIHAGAALHCWPDPSLAVAEISRVLKPGGVFVASTFLNFAAPLGELFGDDNVRLLNQLENRIGPKPYKWWEEAELRELTATMGLVDFVCHRRRRFVLFSVRKPSSAS